NGEIPKFQKPLFGTTPPSALSGLVVQTFPNGTVRLRNEQRAPQGARCSFGNGMLSADLTQRCQCRNEPLR
ncbi:hypothetical protein J7411_17925, partial [Xanthomonas phaseoli pv. dieffenbachiae]|nr:hypothetical protein [Xanthomonas phaseoli pv. dieffenbachiae]